MGIQVMMLTGDSKAVAQWVAQELRLDDFLPAAGAILMSLSTVIVAINAAPEDAAHGCVVAKIAFLAPASLSGRSASRPSS
jgi:high-affinity K+ transport system ATPase subunit B